MIVADTNVVAYLLVSGELTALARAVWERDGDWRLPALWRHEFLNVLATLVKARQTDLAQALATWEHAVALLVSAEQEPDLPSALEIAVTRGLSAYDAQYVALATSLDVTLVTEDRRVLEAVPERARSMAEFLAAGS